jgi:hypothetical protein
MKSEPGRAGTVDTREPFDAIEYCYQQEWTDGLPVVPCTEELLARFLTRTSRQPDDVVIHLPSLNRGCTVRLAAINAAMAGCLPEYFPVVLAAWEAVAGDGYAGQGMWQSTSGSAPLLVANGPVRKDIGLNSAGNVFGSGFRANATIGRALRLTAVNVFGLVPHVLDQATQGTPARYSCCVGENEEESPWPALHIEHGHDGGESTVTAMTIRSVNHVEARHTRLGEQLLRDFAGTISRTGGLLHETVSACVVLSPEHAHLLAGQGWDKPRIKEFLHEHARVSRAVLDSVGKTALTRRTRLRVPADHPEAAPDERLAASSASLPVLASTAAVQVVVAGASNSGVSAVVELFGPGRDGPSMAVVPG